MRLYKQVISNIEGISNFHKKNAKEKVDVLIKPRGSLGKLENLFIKLCSIYKTDKPRIKKRAVVVCVGDHKIIEENVATSNKDITLIQANNMTKGVTGVCALSKPFGADVFVVDVGIDGDVDNENIIQKKVKRGANNFLKEPAMTKEETILAIEAGMSVLNDLVDKGYNIIATGEMGIGNTTPSTAIVSIYANTHPKNVVGVGANLPEDLLSHKANVINSAIIKHKPNILDPLDVLSKVGGLEIAGIVGVMLAGASCGIPIIVDGLISSAAAIIACEISKDVKDYLIGSHKSADKGFKSASEVLNIETYLDMEMRLGEGSGAVLMFPIVDAAISMESEMITFEEAEFTVK